MYTIKRWLVVVLLVGFFPAYAEPPHETLNIFRTIDGRLTPESIENAERLQAVVARRGQISLWLTTRVPFNTNEDELSPKQASAQQKRVNREFRKILQPAIAKGVVWRDPARPNVEGPGCSVVATADGLAYLIEDSRLLNISWTQ